MSEFSILEDIEEYSDEELQEMWNSIPVLKAEEYADAEEITDYEKCPYCGELVGFTIDEFPPSYCIGKKGRYVTNFYRVCPKCEKVYYEPLGEEPDYWI